MEAPERKTGMPNIKNAGIASALLLPLLLAPSAAEAQLIGVLTLDRLSALDTWGTGGRPYAMGTAYTSLSDDVMGIVYNPAGIARVRNREISFGVHQLWQDVDENYDNNPGGTSGSYTSFGHLGAIVPYETYTTDIKFGFGAFRVGSSNLEYVKGGPRPDLGGNVNNVFLQTGSIYHYRFSVAGNLTRNISVGGTMVIWDGSPDFTEEISYTGVDDSSYVFTDNVNADIDGISFEFGILARLSTFLHAGLVFSTPAWITMQGSGIEYYDGNFRDGTGWTTEPYSFYGEEDYTLPMNIRFGASMQAENLVVALDLAYSDYRQTKYEGSKIYYENDPTIDILDQVWSLRAGAELTIPWTPLSFRAGYLYIPLPFKGMEEMTYVEEDIDEFWLLSDWDFVNFTEEREYYTAGIGYIFDDRLALDIAVSRGSFERKTYWLTEKKVVTELLASAAYRF
jgi:hypothetical protein